MENKNEHEPIPNNTGLEHLKNIDNEIHKTLRTFSLSPKIRRSYTEKELVVGFAWMENKN